MGKRPLNVSGLETLEGPHKSAVTRQQKKKALRSPEEHTLNYRLTPMGTSPELNLHKLVLRNVSHCLLHRSPLQHVQIST